jgi:quercetin dioxygenase-like cupin family protein
VQVITMKDLPTEEQVSVSLWKVFEQKNVNGKITMGKVVIPPGERVPLEGVSIHEQNEYSIVIKGSFIAESGGKQYRINAGDATFIPAGEEHAAYNDGNEVCEIVWVLVG